MIIGIDFSGKIGQFPLIIVAVRTDNFSSLYELRKHLIKRGSSIGSRKIIKARDLRVAELSNFCKSLNFDFSYLRFSSVSYEKYRKLQERMRIRNFVYHLLAALIFKTYSPLIKPGDKLFIHQEYTGSFSDVVKKDLDSLNIRFLKVKPEITISLENKNEIQLADLIAGSIKKGIRLKKGIEVFPRINDQLDCIMKKKFGTLGPHSD
jgi:hypothetical protein